MGKTKTMRRHPVEWINDQVVVFRDDDRDGWKLTLTRGNDGDFWVGMVPDFRDIRADEREAFDGRCGSIRVRMPLIGGGEHPELYKTLGKLWNELEKERPSEASDVR